MYVSPNFRTKKQLKEAVLSHHRVEVFSPGLFPAKLDGEETIEGPHFPQPHSWYARVLVEHGLVTKVLS